MKKILSVLFLVLVLFSFSACSESSEEESEEKISIYKPSEAYVIECLKATPNVVNVAPVTEENDPNDKLNKKGGYYAAIYFSTDFLGFADLKGDELIEEGTSAGGCIELYNSEDDAKNRDEYLANFDGGLLDPGYHTVVGTIVVRISGDTKVNDHKILEDNIINILMNGKEDEEASIIVTTTPITTAVLTTTAPTTTKPAKITVTMSEDEFVGLSKSEAEKKFKKMGFSVFKSENVETEDQQLDGKICYVEIKKSENSLVGSFSKGDNFEKDAIVILRVYKYVEPEKPKAVSYSTNDYETAKKGNTGVFSYKNTSSYDVYWIIDLDEGYVYFFTDGNGEIYCDKVKIVSGTLNDSMMITWDYGSEECSWYLHFKYVDHPETLVIYDHLGVVTEFTTTNLEEALKLREAKEILEY